METFEKLLRDAAVIDQVMMMMMVMGMMMMMMMMILVVVVLIIHDALCVEVRVCVLVVLFGGQILAMMA